MHYLVDNKNKIIFGWSEKCGCSHVKNLFYFFQTNNIKNEIHKGKDCQPLPKNIAEYAIILFIRNPYKRLVSGFLDKYKEGGQYRNRWRHHIITFSNFVDELIGDNWKMVEKSHFIQQTRERFDVNIITKAKSFKIYDIENIDYTYIEELYGTKIPQEVLNFKGDHIRKNFALLDYDKDQCVYDLDSKIYFNYNVSLTKFYNQEIKSKVYNFFKNDFIFFKEYGFDYDI